MPISSLVLTDLDTSINRRISFAQYLSYLYFYSEMAAEVRHTGPSRHLINFV